MDDPDWTEIHLRNYKCAIDTRFWAFYFKIFHNSIAFNDFLFKIKRKDSSNCCFCEKYLETMIHVQWHSHWGGKGGQSATPDSKKFAKNREKRGKIRKVLSLCPS